MATPAPALSTMVDLHHGGTWMSIAMIVFWLFVIGLVIWFALRVLTKVQRSGDSLRQTVGSTDVASGDERMPPEGAARSFTSTDEQQP